MAASQIGTIEFQCGECGSDQIRVEGDGSPSDKFHCAKCGAFLATRAGAIEAAKQTAKSAVPDIAAAIRKSLKL